MQTVAAAGEMRLDAPPDVARDILRRRNHTVERRHFVVQKAVVERLHYLAVQHVLHFFQVEYHAGYRVGLAFQADLQQVVVPVAVGVGGQAENTLVLLVGEPRIAADVRSRKFNFPVISMGQVFDVRAGLEIQLIIVLPMQTVKTDLLLKIAIAALLAALVYVIYDGMHERVGRAGRFRAGFHRGRR